jgi:S1-C subfamily serine protease
LWTAGEETVKHTADVIQTQTPINLGNSCGFLIIESGNLIGVNTMKAEGERLNFAVCVDEVGKFLAKTNKGVPGLSQADCQPSKFQVADQG